MSAIAMSTFQETVANTEEFLRKFDQTQRELVVLGAAFLRVYFARRYPPFRVKKGRGQRRARRNTRGPGAPKVTLLQLLASRA